MRGKKDKDSTFLLRISSAQLRFFKAFCNENGLSLSDVARKAISYEINRLKKKLNRQKQFQLHQRFLECGGNIKEFAIRHNKGVVDIQVILASKSVEERAAFLQKLVDGGVKRGFSLSEILDYIRNTANLGGSVTLEELEPIYKASLLLFGKGVVKHVSH